MEKKEEKKIKKEKTDSVRLTKACNQCDWVRISVGNISRVSHEFNCPNARPN